MAAPPEGTRLTHGRLASVADPVTAGAEVVFLGSWAPLQQQDSAPRQAMHRQECPALECPALIEPDELAEALPDPKAQKLSASAAEYSRCTRHRE